MENWGINFYESSSSISIMYLKMKESLLFGLNRQSYTASLQEDRLKVEGASGMIFPHTASENAVNENYSFNPNCILIVYLFSKAVSSVFFF